MANNKEIHLHKVDKPYIDDNQYVRFSEQGNITEIFYSVRKSYGGCIQKINRDYYINTRTSELKQFNHIENRSEDKVSVAESLKKLRDLLNTNITDVSKCRWLTFTYKENMTNPKKLMYDFGHCVPRVRKIFGHFEYIACAEPQARGAWHLHCVFIFPFKAPYMDNKIVAECWKQGYVTVKKLDDVDNVGAYLTAYLGDLDLSESDVDSSSVPQNQIKSVETVDDETGQKVSKKIIKGGRLHLYPPKFNIYRKSKGIKNPVVSEILYFKAKEKVSSAQLTYQKSVAIESHNFNNILSYEYYNSIRKSKSQD